LPEPPEDLAAAVRDQAEARVRADVQGVARYLTPEAIDSLRASFTGIPPRVNAYEVADHQPRGDDHVFDVRYSARDDSFIVRSRWRRLDESWMVVHAERLWAAGDKRPGILSRLFASILGALPRRR
jgi:hypothetical protein